MENGHLPKLTLRVMSTAVTKQDKFWVQVPVYGYLYYLIAYSTVTMSRHILEDIMGQGIFPIDDMDEATLCGRGRV